MYKSCPVLGTNWSDNHQNADAALNTGIPTHIGLDDPTCVCLCLRLCRASMNGGETWHAAQDISVGGKRTSSSGNQMWAMFPAAIALLFSNLGSQYMLQDQRLLSPQVINLSSCFPCFHSLHPLTLSTLPPARPFETRPTADVGSRVHPSLLPWRLQAGVQGTRWQRGRERSGCQGTGLSRNPVSSLDLSDAPSVC